MDLGAQLVGDRLLDRRAQQRVPERRPAAALALEHAHAHELAGRDVRIQAQIGIELAGRRISFQLRQHAVDLVLGEIGAEQRAQARVRGQLGRQAADLALGEPVGHRQVGQPRQLVGGDETDAGLRIAADDAVALEAANQLAAAGTGCRAFPRPASPGRAAGMCSSGNSSRRASSVAASVAERPELQAQVRRRCARPSSASSAPAPGAPRRRPRAARRPRAWSRTRALPASRRPRGARRRGSPPAVAPARAGAAPGRRCG